MVSSKKYNYYLKSFSVHFLNHDLQSVPFLPYHIAIVPTEISGLPGVSLNWDDAKRVK